MKRILFLLLFVSVSTFGQRAIKGLQPNFPQSLSFKFAGWWKGETTNYITDQINKGQEREIATQNSQAGQVFPGRAVKYNGTTQYSMVVDNGALDIGNTADFTLCGWVNVDAADKTSGAYVFGKNINGGTQGRYGISVSITTGFITALIQPSGGTATRSTAIDASTLGWTHVIMSVDNTHKLFSLYINGVLSSSALGFTGTFPAPGNSYEFYIGSGNNGAGTSFSIPTASSIHDVRLFRRLLNPVEIASVVNGDYVQGFSEWWMMCGNGTTEHSAKQGGQHLTNTAFAGGSRVTGYWAQQYNQYGYAENATFGQIPPDMSSATPTLDCLGNALVFVGSAKLNLAKVSTNFKMFDGAPSTQLTTLFAGTNLISLNTWFSGTTAQSIAVASVATYCGSRQFYNTTTKELIVMKEGQHLTPSEETALMTYMGSPAIPTTYHANSTTLFARFTNTYSDAEKSRLDNTMRLLVSTGVYAKMEVLYFPAIRGAQEQLLNWISTSFNLSALGTAGTPSAHVTALPYRGIAAQKDSYKNSYNPTSSSTFTQNDCFTSFKLAQNFQQPEGDSNDGLMFGCYTGGAGQWATTYFYDAANGMSVYFYLNSAAPSQVKIQSLRKNQTYVGVRTGSTAGAIYSTGAQLGTFSNASSTRANFEMLVGNASSATGTENSTAPVFNWIQHLAFGASLTSVQALSLASIADNYGDGQLALITTPWIQDSGFKYMVSDKCFIDRLGDQVIWSDYQNLYYSTDAGVTIKSSFPFTSSSLGYINLCHIFDNGKIIFATSKNKIYKTTTTAFPTYTEMIPTYNGTPITVHTPANASYPGEYYKFLGVKAKQYQTDATEIFTWNTYATTSLGPAPAYVWRSFGDDVKAVYEFGTNPYFTDNGTPNGSTGGTLLGDATNTTYWVKHGHSLRQDPQNKTDFYSAYGDFSGRAALSPMPLNFSENMIMKHVHNEGADTWTTTQVKTGSQSSRWKANSLNIVGDTVYWSSDAGTTGTASIELGFHKEKLSGMGSGTDVQFYLSSLVLPMNMYIYDGTFLLSGGFATNTGNGPNGGFTDPYIIYSPDNTHFTETILKIPGAPYFFEIIKVSPKVYMLNGMHFYNYYLGAFSVTLDFN